MKMPSLLLFLIAFDLILAGLGLYGGINLLLDPTGASIGMSPALEHIPIVTDFLLFGIWLVVVFAALPLVLIYGLLTDRKWSIYGSVALVALELVWVGVQVALFYDMTLSIWQIGIMALVAVVGVASIVILVRHSVRDFLLRKIPSKTTQV